jgi:hypothetical protein
MKGVKSKFQAGGYMVGRGLGWSNLWERFRLSRALSSFQRLILLSARVDIFSDSAM